VLGFLLAGHHGRAARRYLFWRYKPTLGTSFDFYAVQSLLPVATGDPGVQHPAAVAVSWALGGEWLICSLTSIRFGEVRRS